MLRSRLEFTEGKLQVMKTTEIIPSISSQIKSSCSTVASL